MDENKLSDSKYFFNTIRSTIKDVNMEKQDLTPTVKEYSRKIYEKLKLAGEIAQAEFKAESKTGMRDIKLKTFSMVREKGKEKQTVSMFFILVKSSWVKYVAYDFKNKVLYVVFHKASNVGKLCDMFRYFNIDEETYAKALTTPSSTIRAIKKQNNNEGSSFERIGIYSYNSVYKIINSENINLEQEGSLLGEILKGSTKTYKENNIKFKERINKITYQDKTILMYYQGYYSKMYTNLKHYLQIKSYDTLEKIQTITADLEMVLKDTHIEYVRNLKLITYKKQFAVPLQDIYNDAVEDHLNGFK